MSGWRKRQIEEKNVKIQKEEKVSYEELAIDCERMRGARDALMLSNANLKVENYELKNRQWPALIQGVRVDGDTVVVKVKGGNNAARELCGALIEEMNK
jgi:hypothetical protein